MDDTVNISGKKERDVKLLQNALGRTIQGNQMYLVNDMPVFKHAILISYKLNLDSECLTCLLTTSSARLVPVNG